MVDKIIGLVGLALALFGIFAPMKWPAMPSWITDLGVATGCLLFGLALGLYLGDRRESSSALATHTAELSLRAFGDGRTPVAISSTNVWRWYHLQNILVAIEKDTGKRAEHALTNLFVNFEKPVRVGTLTVTSPDAQLPRLEVKEFNNRFAVITFQDQLPLGTIVITVR